MTVGEPAFNNGKDFYLIEYIHSQDGKAWVVNVV